MPRYDYRCCGIVFEAYATIEGRNAVKCPTCGAPASMTFITPPMTQLPSQDALYNYSQGYFDYGLGCYIRTRKQREKKMDALGVSPVTDTSAEEFVPKKTKKPKITNAAWKDAYEYGQAQLRKGWKPFTDNDVKDIQKSIGVKDGVPVAH